MCRPKAVYGPVPVSCLRIEQVKQNQHAVLVVVKLAIVGGISLATVVVQSLQHRRKLIEILQARDIRLLDLRLLKFFPRHAQQDATKRLS